MLSNTRSSGSNVLRIWSKQIVEGRNERVLNVRATWNSTRNCHHHCLPHSIFRKRIDIKSDAILVKHRRFSTNFVPRQPADQDKSNDGQKVVDYLLADVGEGITECEIVKWFVEPGSHVEEFDNLVEVQSDKASVEITSRYSGVVVEHCYQVGQVARVGSPLCRIRLESQSKDEDSNMINESEEGKGVQSNIVMEEAPVPIHTNVQSEILNEQASSSSSLPPNSESSFSDARHATLATPAVRRLTRENAVQIKDIQGTGKDGRVTKEDVQQFIKNRSTNQASSQTEARSETSFSSSPVVAPVETANIPLSGVRKAMFKAMSATWNAPHFGYSDEIDVTQLDSIRQKLNKSNEQQGGKEARLTLLPFLLKAISITLHDHPLFRSTFNLQEMILRQSQEHRLSIAFASSKGLITPTLQGDARSLSILDIANQINHLQTIGASRGLNQSEMGSGATITLSNIGSIGGTHTFPLIPPTGQLIIGAIGRTRILPRFEGNPADGKIKAASILPVSFSADHRIVEGIELAKFVNDWKRLLENPTSWMLKMH